METVILITAAASLLLSLIILVLLLKGRNDTSDREIVRLQQQIKALQENNDNAQSNLRQEINNNINSNVKALGDGLKESQMQSSESQSREIKTLTDTVNNSLAATRTDVSGQLKQFENRLGTLEKNTEEKLESVRRTLSNELATLRTENNKQLDKIRGTVDEKLQETLDKKLSESFNTVSVRLQEVYKGLGEMQNLAKDVGDLKNVLSNVKTRGIVGEIQLGAILGEILAPNQYEENIATVAGSSERVEFAVRLPGSDGEKPVYLPIDSKFNSIPYTKLQSAYEAGDKTLIDASKKELEAAIKKNAKDIHDKYISPPDTTEFGIMFLPFEGLYAEVVNSGLVDTIQREYHVNIAGPSTMSALLNSLHMGFRTLAIEKRSHEVWKTLGAGKTEFGKFKSALEKTQKKLKETEENLDHLVGTRTRQIERKLKEVESIDPDESERLLSE